MHVVCGEGCWGVVLYARWMGGWDPYFFTTPHSRIDQPRTDTQSHTFLVKKQERRGDIDPPSRLRTQPRPKFVFVPKKKTWISNISDRRDYVVFAHETPRRAFSSILPPTCTRFFLPIGGYTPPTLIDFWALKVSAMK
jgi:hypothetical protein